MDTLKQQIMDAAKALWEQCSPDGGPLHIGAQYLLFGLEHSIHVTKTSAATDMPVVSAPCFWVIIDRGDPHVNDLLCWIPPDNRNEVDLVMGQWLPTYTDYDILRARTLFNTQLPVYTVGPNGLKGMTGPDGRVGLTGYPGDPGDPGGPGTFVTPDIDAFVAWVLSDDTIPLPPGVRETRTFQDLVAKYFPNP